MNRIGAIALAAVALVSLARPASAQLPGIPYGPVETGLQFNLAADYAQPSSDLGGGAAYGLTGGLGFGRFGFSGSFGTRDRSGSGTPSVDGQMSYGGRVGMRLIGGGLNPLSIGVQVGGSTTEDLGTVTGTTPSNLILVMPGAWVKVSPPLFPIKPWGQVYYVTGDNVPTEEARFAIGANLNLLFGFGLHGAYDWGDSGATWGVGAHFTFRVPGVGVPLAPGM